MTTTQTRFDRVMVSQRKLLVLNAAATVTYVGTLCASILALL
jgi:hypothetical protein